MEEHADVVPSAAVLGGADWKGWLEPSPAWRKAVLGGRACKGRGRGGGAPASRLTEAAAAHLGHAVVDAGHQQVDPRREHLQVLAEPL